MRPALFALFLTLLASLGAAAHEPDAAAPVAVWPLQVQVAGQPVLSLDAAAFAKLPQSSVTAHTHEDADARWGGVALIEILRAAGAPMDKALRGKALAMVVRVTAADGYQVVFGLGELDAAFGKQQVLVATQRDGKALDKDGPLRLVVPGDTRAGRWVRNVQRIEVLALAP
jgi:DMSO/TMAO reductase YedYZ molybdopterin-dependent catalytic subunit